MEYVLITGSSTGIGLELAKVFAKEGYPLILVSSQEEKLSNAKRQVEQIQRVPILTYVVDLSVLGNAKQLYEKIKQLKIDVSIVINNAGFGLVGTTDSISNDKDEKMILLNNIALVTLTKYFLNDMYIKGKGKILNVASTGAFFPGPYTATYFASKAFVLSYSRAVRYEAKARGVSISTLCPGATKTDFFNKEGIAEPTNAMSAGKVAKIAYQGLSKNKEVIIPGLFNKLQCIIPTYFKMKIVARMKNR